MPVDYDQVDDVAATVAALYAEAERALVARISRQLAQGYDGTGWAETKLAAVGSLRRAAQVIVAALSFSAATTLRRGIADAYQRGQGDAIADLPDRFAPRSGIGAAARAARLIVPNTGAVDALARSVVADLRPLADRITRDVVDGYRAVVAATAARVLTGTQTRRDASQAAWLGLVRRGLTSFQDRAGRRWQLPSYVEMATRTVTARAAVQGHVDALVGAEFRLIYIPDHVQECPVCRPWEGKILALYGATGDVTERSELDGRPVRVHVAATLAEARAAGLHHPSCRHGAAAYLPGVTRIRPAQADPDGYKARMRQRALERRIRAAKLEQAAAFTPDAKRAANAKVRAAQAALREHLAAHPDLKRLRYREQIGAGNLPTPGTVPAGGVGPNVQPPLGG